MRRLYFVLLRAPAKVGKDLRKRLEATYKAISAKIAPRFPRPLRGLDLLLHGRIGVERSGYRPGGVELGLYDLIFCDDDPKFVVSELKKKLPKMQGHDSVPFTARYGFIGGAAAVKLLRDHPTSFARSDRKVAEAQLARIAARPK